MVSKHVSAGDRCFICAEPNLHVLISHHIVPSAYGGSDGDHNRVVLCANCHQAIHKIYSDAVFTRLGVPKENEDVRDTDVTGLYDFENLTSTEQFEFLKRQMSEKELSDALAGIFVGGTFPQIGESKDAESIDEHVSNDPENFYYLDLGEKFEYLVRNHKDVVYQSEDTWANKSVVSASIDRAFETIAEAKDIEIDDDEPEGDAADDETDPLREAVKEQVHELREEYPGAVGAPKEELIENLSREPLPCGEKPDNEDIKYAIRMLRDKGEIYSPDQNHLRAV